MLHGMEFFAASANAVASPVLLVVGVGVVALATAVGAWLARRRDGQQQVWFGAAAGALLVIALLHLLPDAWTRADDAGMPTWLVPAVALVSFSVSILVSRVGCACQADEENVAGAGSAAALAVHRFLEGAALSLAGVVTAAAIAVHALGEGLAVGALLRTRPRRLVCWIAVMCVGPAIGAVTVEAIPALRFSEPVLLSVAAGVLAQAARISLRAAFPKSPRQSRSVATAAAVFVSASATALAVFAAG